MQHRTRIQCRTTRAPERLDRQNAIHACRSSGSQCAFLSEFHVPDNRSGHRIAMHHFPRFKSHFRAHRRTASICVRAIGPVANMRRTIRSEAAIRGCRKGGLAS
jgi:hypothetical protein